MITPTGVGGFESILRELRKSQGEDQQIYRQQSNHAFNQKIKALEDQASILREKANKIGGFGIANFVIGLVQTAITTAMAFVGGGMSKTMQNVMSGITNSLNMLKEFLGMQNQTSLAKLDAQGKEKEVSMEAANQMVDSNEDSKNRAIKQQQETLDTLKEVQRTLNQSTETLIRIEK